MIYKSVVRSALTFGAGVVHTTPNKRDGPPIVATDLAPTPNEALRRVSGVYKAIRVTYLEAELGIPPLDLYMAGRKKAFERRAKAGRTEALLIETRRKIVVALKPRVGLGMEIPPPLDNDWADEPIGEVIARTWKDRWKEGRGSDRNQTVEHLFTVCEDGKSGNMRERGLRTAALVQKALGDKALEMAQELIRVRMVTPVPVVRSPQKARGSRRS